MNKNTIHGIFPCPINFVKRDSNLSSEEEKDIEDIIENGMYESRGNVSSDNSNIFNDKLKNIRQFCEQQLEIYVEQIINPKQELDFYITQSWLNVTKPGGFHHEHSHQNSIISGVFYLKTEETDKISFIDPNGKLKDLINFDKKEFNLWNSTDWSFESVTNELILFPSWLVHFVQPNRFATKDRISLSFNTFARGIFGAKKDMTELIL